MNVAARARSAFGAVQEWALHSEGSTRSAALIRILLALVLWARFGMDWVQFARLSDGTWPVGLCFFVATTMALVGLYTRVATALTAATLLFMVYGLGHYLDLVEPYRHHHVTLLAWLSLCVALTPSGRSYSIDRWLEVRKAERRGEAPPAEFGNLWGLRLMELQVCSVYLWTALDKCNPAFLNGTDFQRILMYYYTGTGALPAWVASACMSAALATVALEFSLGLGLPFKATRKWLVVPGLLFHAAIYVTLSVYTFSATMWVAYLSFYEPDDVHDTLERLQGHGSPSQAAPRASV